MLHPQALLTWLRIKNKTLRKILGQFCEVTVCWGMHYLGFGTQDIAADSTG